MAILHRSSRPRSAIPTSSMADIAFLLLIFFLVTTVFDEEQGLMMVLPADGDTRDVPASNLLFLIVLPDGSVELRLGESPQSRRIRPGDVAAIWRQEVAANPDLIASVQTSPDARYEQMIAVLDALKVAGATRIALQELER